MATQTVDKKWLYISIILMVSVLGIAIFFVVNAGKSRPGEQVYQDYEELEKAYEKAVKELETVSNNDYGSIDILKNNLQKVLDEIKTEKERLEERRRTGDYSIGDMDTSQAQNYMAMLEMSKQVADAMLVERLERMERENEELKKVTQQLNTRNQELEENIEQMQEYVEQEKTQNMRLNEALTKVNEQLDIVVATGDSTSDELQRLQMAKQEYERRLQESNRTIQSQNQQIQGFVKTLRKVSSNVYYVFEEGNPDKEVKIYLTSNGISNQYLTYFNNKKPNVYILFNINEELFKEGVEKVDLKIYNNENIEIYSTSKTISSGNLTVQIPGNIFAIGDYYVELKNGDENLLVGDEYHFKIGSE